MPPSANQAQQEISTNQTPNPQEIALLRQRIKELESKMGAPEQKTEQQVRPEVQPRVEAAPAEQDRPTAGPVPVQQDIQQVQTQPQDDTGIPAQVDPNDLANQVAVLVKVALTDGIDKAITQAKKSKNPFLLDELHDTLVDHLYEQLVRMNKVEGPS